MTPALLEFLCDPHDKSVLNLVDPVYDEAGRIQAVTLVSENGRVYPILNGVPRFVLLGKRSESVRSFGDEWNFFNFDQFKLNWLGHTVKNTFGSTEAFEAK